MDTTTSNGILLATDLVRSFSGDLSASLNTTTLVYGAAIVGGLLILSFALYMLDTWATARIDNMLLNYYGPEMYDRYTSVYDPTGLGAAYQTQSDSQLTDWTDEDVIRAYLVSQQEAQERLYLQQQAELAQNNNYYQHLAGYRSFGGEWWQDLLKNLSQLHQNWEDFEWKD